MRSQPPLHTCVYYNWSDIQSTLEARLGRDLRDYAGRRKNGYDETTPYQNFWHWWLENVLYDAVHNGSIMCPFFAEIEMDRAPDWAQEILREMKAMLGERWDNETCILYSW